MKWSSARLAPPPVTPQSAAEATAWREALWAWSRQALGDAPAAPLPSLASPLGALAERAQLDVPAQRILHALYADWLAGHGDVGLAASKLVEIAGAHAWEEALGNGQLGRCRLVSSRVGRCLLAPPVGAHLDGRPPEHVKRLDGARPRTVEPGSYRMRPRDGESHEQCAARLATMVGTVGWSGPDVETARVEAWLHGWVFASAQPIDDARPGEVAVWITDADVDVPPLVPEG